MTRGWRPMLESDLSDVVRMSDTIHVHYPEAPEVVADKFRAFPQGCLVYVGDAGAAIGYCLTHPWRTGAPPALDTRLDALPENPDCYFFHDVALMPAARGQGAVGFIVPRLAMIAQIHGMTRCSLVSVNNSRAFWQHMGFQISQDAEIQAYVRDSYGGDAVFMTREIGRFLTG